MATYKGIGDTLVALEEFFKARLPAELSGGTINAQISLMGSADIAKAISGNVLSIYLHRITIDQHGRNRCFPAVGTDLRPPTAELPVDLHFLLIASATSATIEADLLAWAMVELANQSRLDIGWGENEMISIVPEEMPTEELMRLFELFDKHYTSTMTYVARSIRLRLNQSRTEGPAVVTRVLPGGMK